MKFQLTLRIDKGFRQPCCPYQSPVSAITFTHVFIVMSSSSSKSPGKTETNLLNNTCDSSIILCGNDVLIVQERIDGYTSNWCLENFIIILQIERNT